MATDAQIAANRQNAQLSTGPKTPEGKAKSCMNNFRWGFTGAFCVLPTESQEEFDNLHEALRTEHCPTTPTEELLVEKMAQAAWLSRRAQLLQQATILQNVFSQDQERQFALFLRYQTANDRLFQRCLHDLLKLRAEKRKAEIGFESKENREREQAERARLRAQAEERKQAAETRKQELHKFAVLLAQAKLDHQSLQNALLDPSNPVAMAATHRLNDLEKAA
jgi:hypothetical protein